MADAEHPLGEIQLAATTLYVEDLEAAVAWYETTLGLVPVSLGKDAEGYASYLLGGAVLVLEPRSAALEASPPGSENATVNLIVTIDPAEVRTSLLARSVSCGELVMSPNFTSFLMRDLDGNRYYITRPRTAEATGEVSSMSSRLSAT